MSPTLSALVAFSVWTGLLVFGLANLRIFIARSQGKELNTFRPDGTDLEGLGNRWTRAHLNCLEFLPIFGVVALSAVASGNAAVTDGLAWLVFYLRLGQSVAHMASTSMPFVLIRAMLFVGQLLIVLNWARQLLMS
ncbi:MAG: MAPEG family protein [Deltaproteobacteria bacterium]|nr:MAPEG family protein [Deltaproteobacteria bacterium]MBW2446113.1 MAPEG family protein [Deltaproteobacteria bacterium]